MNSLKFPLKSILGVVNSKNHLLQRAACLSLKPKRNFLTDNYYCYDQWDKFLLSDTIKNTQPVNIHATDLDNKLKNKVLVTPLDIHLLAAKLVYVSNFQELQFIESVFESFRQTQAALYVRDSLHYSFVRSYIDISQSERLLQILKLKYKYGIYLDSFTANMLMDHFVKQKNFKHAALAAHEVLLQENKENELTTAASLFSCLKYYIEGYKPEDEVNQNEEDEEQKKEKVLVYFKRKPYDDEHFDLKSIKRLTGKAIYFASSNAKTIDPVLANSLRIYGLLVFEKFEKAIELLESTVQKKEKIHNLVLEEIKKNVEKIQQNEEEAKNNDTFLSKWANLSKIYESDQAKLILDNNIDVLKEVENYLENVKKSQIPLDINSQTELYKKWQTEYENDYKEQERNLRIEEKKESIRRRLETLEKEEEILTFFDNRQKIINSYYGKGFLPERASQIPIEPEESKFAAKAERHFKPWPKFMNRPETSLRVSKMKQYKLESMKKIYLKNEGEKEAQAK